MGDLFDKLSAYAETDYYPYHMPGHKRRLGNPSIETIKELDITEIEGFDNLHDAHDILWKIQKKAAKIYGADESFFLVNGSTAGVLAAISATVEEGSKLLMVRNSHKSAYHAAYLRKLSIKYLWPELNEEFGIVRAITAKEVEQALEKEEGIGAVFIVSPTYEGYVADVEAIAKAVHKYGIPLIVDEAHGAHLGFHPSWAKNSISLGADVAIQSLHKTLPSLTQTAILHTKSNLIDRKKLERFLQIYQTSSPSYLFMASIEDALDLVVNNKEALFSSFLSLWDEMLHRLSVCQSIRVLQDENRDIGKLIISDFSGNYSGKRLYEILLKRYHLQMEMASKDYVLAMFTIGDTKEGYDRLTDALLEIDRECRLLGKRERTAITEAVPNLVLHKPALIYPLYKAWTLPVKEVEIEQADDCVAGEFINLYPPGTPCLVPGERISKEESYLIQKYMEYGLVVQGIDNRDGKIYINVLRD